MGKISTSTGPGSASCSESNLEIVIDIGMSFVWNLLVQVLITLFPLML